MENVRVNIRGTKDKSRQNFIAAGRLNICVDNVRVEFIHPHVHGAVDDPALSVEVGARERRGPIVTRVHAWRVELEVIVVTGGVHVVGVSGDVACAGRADPSVIAGGVVPDVVVRDRGGAQRPVDPVAGVVGDDVVCHLTG